MTHFSVYQKPTCFSATTDNIAIVTSSAHNCHNRHNCHNITIVTSSAHLGRRHMQTFLFHHHHPTHSPVGQLLSQPQLTSDGATCKLVKKANCPPIHRCAVHLSKSIQTANSIFEIQSECESQILIPLLRPKGGFFTCTNRRLADGYK